MWAGGINIIMSNAGFPDEERAHMWCEGGSGWASSDGEATLYRGREDLAVEGAAFRDRGLLAQGLDLG